ncbi:sigma-70 family RNA polymerase sigma factor [Bacillus inaquosorum]|uniref:sigma-70 family RNA polymerase sigma factor n=1 Tax=Bacillus subtilis group TaxID=653685 RepID=UPI0027E4B89E|nr:MULTISPECIES: sigma-70 family RNA polymerase sigma factor [Bacillus subtilis group]MDQ7723548.1 sigma-70 family RNA polymerase sigma factor [Bacillus halotolerans]MEC0596613.1 sigma-70 family RNA polymerase sigma factor [Bacillus spizizenii]MED4645803.1 sigma-70 family RNA polymerase sigma factor [Bacillus inaquosorum]MED4790654.1 sigma-70 family RNA polymerase sigma factor [Bacillus inaquosorum]
MSSYLESEIQESSEERCLQRLIREKFKEIKELPLVKQFTEDKDNEKLLNEAFEKGDIQTVRKLNNEFREFSKRMEAIRYVNGILKRYPIDYDKRVKKRNNRCLLILDKSVDANGDTSTTSFLELLQDPRQEEELSKNILQDSIFEIDNEKLKKAVNSLKPNQKKILKLIYEDNYTQREISKIIGQTEQNIYYWHKKTIKQLKNELTAI